MANITAQDINKLRKITGVGMMDCKQALIEAEGDFDKAIQILRKKGQKVASKRADRETTEGIALAQVSQDATKGFGFLLGCETDFVARSEDFINAANIIMQTIISNNYKNLDELLEAKIPNKSITIKELIDELLGKIQEKIILTQYHCVEGAYVCAYVHHNKRISTLVAFNKKVSGIEEAAKEIAMQIAAMAPLALDENSIPNDILEKEREIAIEQSRLQNIPENKLEMVVQGKIQKFIKENTLLNQPLLINEKITVRQYLQSLDKDLSITQFLRISVA